MKTKQFLSFFIIAILLFSCVAKNENNKKAISNNNNFIFIQGGQFVNTKSNYYGKNIAVASFYMSKYEVSQKEWVAIMGSNPSNFIGDSLPVESVSWYDCIEFCNKKSLIDGLKPYYKIEKEKRGSINDDERDSVNWTITPNEAANGYRLPKDIEWEYAAGGGRNSKSYTYCGSNDVDEVAWHYKNSGDVILLGFWNQASLKGNHCKTHAIGSKKSNELGLFNMSGNVKEWCWDWNNIDKEYDFKGRSWRGGGWAGVEFCCEAAYKDKNAANRRPSDQGCRICRSEKM